jgi:hypothetical protein
MGGKGRWGRKGLILCVLCVLCGDSASVLAQFQMPDLKQMSGIPRPVSDLPDRAISVRLIRGDLSNNITSFPVELHIGSRGATVQTVKTDDTGRAQFTNLPAGATVKAIAIVDGERLESQEFPVPAQGGIRVMLVATDKEQAAKAAAAPPAAPVPGQVSLGGQTRIILEPGDDAVQVYYLLEIVNAARAPVNPPALFMFDMPTGAVGTALVDGSSPQANVNGTRVRVQGPFAPGRTLVQVACEIPSETGALRITQRFPASLEQLTIVVKKIGATKLTSAQVTNQQDMAAEGETFIAASGGTIPAGQPIVLGLEDMPHRSPAPRWAALSLAIVIVGIGVWSATRPADRAAHAAERKRAIARRQKLLSTLVKLETDHRHRRVDAARYETRREELVTALEHIYGALDTDDTSSEPTGRAGLTA